MWKVEFPQHYKMKNAFTFKLVAPYQSSIKTFQDDGIIREASVKVTRLNAAVMRKHKVPQDIIDRHSKPTVQRLVTPPIMPKARPMKSKKTNDPRLVKSFKPTREQLIADIGRRKLQVVITRLSQEVIDSHLNGPPKRKLIPKPKRRSKWTNKPILPPRQVTEKTYRKPAWLQEKNLTVQLIKTPAESSLSHPYILNEPGNQETDNRHAKKIMSDPGLVNIETPPQWVNGGYTRDQVETQVPNFSEEIQHGANSISLSHDQYRQAVNTYYHRHMIGPSSNPVQDHVEDQDELVQAEVRFGIQRVNKGNQPAPPSTSPTTLGPLVGSSGRELKEADPQGTNVGHRQLEDDHESMAAKVAATPTDDLEFLDNALFNGLPSTNISVSSGNESDHSVEDAGRDIESTHSVEDPGHDNESTRSVEDAGQPAQDIPILTMTVTDESAGQPTQEKTILTIIERSAGRPDRDMPIMTVMDKSPGRSAQDMPILTDTEESDRDMPIMTVMEKSPGRSAQDMPTLTVTEKSADQSPNDAPILTVTEKSYAIERNNNSPQEARPPTSAATANPVYLRCVDNSIYGLFYPGRIRAGYRFQYPHLTETETDQAAHTYMARISKAFTNPLGYDKATQTYEPPSQI